MVMNALITGWGFYVPAKVLTNADLEAMVDTTDAWIYERTGIRERHIVEGNEVTSGMATKAAREALVRAGVRGGPGRDHHRDHLARLPLAHGGVPRAGGSRRALGCRVRSRCRLRRLHLRARCRARPHRVGCGADDPARRRR